MTTQSRATLADVARLAGVSSKTVSRVFADAGNVSADTGTRSLDVLKHGGLYLNVPTGSWPEYASAAAARGMRASSVKVESDGSNLGIIGRLIDAGDVRVEVQHVYPLAQVHEALSVLQGGHVRGKLVLKIR